MEQTLNRLLVQFFKYIMEIEEKKLITEEFADIMPYSTSYSGHF